MALTKVTTAMANTATQAEQETGTSTDRFVPTGRQRFHPSAAKAWVSFNGTGTIAIAASFNVTSLTDNGTGSYTVNLTTSFSGAAYSVVASCNEPSGNGHTCNIPGVAGSISSGGFSILTKLHDNTAADTNMVNAVAYGDQ